MDSDDIMPIHKIKALKTNLIIHGEGHIATGLVKYISENELGEGFQKYENWLNTLTREGANFSEIYKECVIPSPCWMVYRNDLIELGISQEQIQLYNFELPENFLNTTWESIYFDIKSKLK